MLVKITPDQYIVRRWAGGTTTQLAIFPEASDYKDHDFLWRVSASSVDLEESEFTMLPGIERMITPIEGSLTLVHDDGPAQKVEPLQVHTFDGGAKTLAIGSGTVFNLMINKEKAKGEVLSAVAAGSDMPFAIELNANEALLLYLVQGRGTVYAANQQPLAVGPSETVLFQQAWSSMVRFNLTAGAKALAVIVEVLPEK